MDEDGEFPYLRVTTFARANGLEDEFDSLPSKTPERVERQGDFLRTHTVLETLEYIHLDSVVAEGVATYYAFVPFGEPYEYAGPELLAAWFERNIKICHNIRALVTSPSDRILVVYGAGRLEWLRQLVEDDESVRLGKLADLIEGSS